MKDAIDIAIRFGFIPSPDDDLSPPFSISANEDIFLEWEQWVKPLAENWYYENLYYAEKYLCDLILNQLKKR